MYGFISSDLTHIAGVTAAYPAALIVNNDTLPQFSRFPDTTRIEESMDEMIRRDEGPSKAQNTARF